MFAHPLNGLYLSAKRMLGTSATQDVLARPRLALSEAEFENSTTSQKSEIVKSFRLLLHSTATRKAALQSMASEWMREVRDAERALSVQGMETATAPTMEGHKGLELASDKGAFTSSSSTNYAARELLHFAG
jgi:hypothetical protein